MSQLSFVPRVDFEGSVRREAASGGRVRGVLSGLMFLGLRLPFYAGAAVLAAVVCVIGVALYGLQAALGGSHV